MLDRGVKNYSRKVVILSRRVAEPRTGWMHDMVCALERSSVATRRTNSRASDYRVLKHPATFNQPLRGTVHRVAVG